MYSDLKERVKQLLDTAEGDGPTWYPKTMYDNILAVCDEYEQKMSWSIEWSPADMIGQAAQAENPWEMDEETAITALEDMIEHHDACYGISWNTVDYYVQKHRPERE